MEGADPLKKRSKIEKHNCENRCSEKGSSERGSMEDKHGDKGNGKYVRRDKVSC